MLAKIFSLSLSSLGSPSYHPSPSVFMFLLHNTGPDMLQCMVFINIIQCYINTYPIPMVVVSFLMLQLAPGQMLQQCFLHVIKTFERIFFLFDKNSSPRLQRLILRLSSDIDIEFLMIEVSFVPPFAIIQFITLGLQRWPATMIHASRHQECDWLERMLYGSAKHYQHHEPCLR